jgi:hypothetical protein
LVSDETIKVWVPRRLLSVMVDPAMLVTRPLTLSGNTTTFVAVGLEAEESSETATFSPFTTPGSATELPGSE